MKRKPGPDPTFSTKAEELDSLAWWLAIHADNFLDIVSTGDPAKILRWSKKIHERAARYAELLGVKP